MIGFNGWYCPKQYISSKPTKWGIKALDMANNWIFDELLISLGKKGVRNKLWFTFARIIPDCGIISILRIFLFTSLRRLKILSNKQLHD